MNFIFLLFLFTASCFSMESEMVLVKAAIYTNDVQQLEKLLPTFNDPSKSATQCSDDDPYFIALYQGKVTILRLFIENGYNIEQQLQSSSMYNSPRYLTPLECADAYKHKKIKKLLGWYKRLKEAVIKQKVKRIQSLFTSKNLFCNARYGNYRTLLHIACHHKSVKSIDPLLQVGIDVNALDSNGHTALYLASSQLSLYAPNNSLAEKLIEHGADIDIALERAQREKDEGAEIFLIQLRTKKVSFKK